MSPDLPDRALARRLERGLGALAGGAFRRPGLTWAIVALLSVVAVIGAKRLRLDTDLVGLLPESFRSVQDLSALEDRFGAIGYVVVVGQGAEPETLKRFADDLAPKLEALPSIRYVDHRRPIDFFAEHGLYYLDVEDLETIRDRLSDRATWERRQRNPMYMDLEEEAAPSLTFDDLRRRYAGRDNGVWVNRQVGGAYYLDEARRMVVLLARPARRATDMAFAKEVVAETRELLTTIDTSAYGPNLTVALTGRYEKKLAQKEHIQSNLKLASTVAVVLVLLYLALHFRRASAVALVMVPLLIGLMWTFGFAGYLFGVLNLLTGFIGAILLGLGIDHGIHLLSRYDAERARGADAADAVRSAFGQTGRAVIIAALTTTVAFAGLAFSEFRAFREFGAVAAAGMVLIVAAYTVCLPALLGLGAAARASQTSPRAVTSSSFARVLPRWAPTVFWLLTLIGVGTTTDLDELRFDYDFAALEDSRLPAFELDHEVNRILGYSQTPALVLTESEAEERAVADALRAGRAERGATSTIDFIASVADLVPPDQARKQAILSKIRRIVRRVKPSWLSPEDQERRTTLLKATQAVPFDRATLPVLVRRQFQGGEASTQEGFVLAFPSIALSDGARVPDFAAELRAGAEATGTTRPVAGEAMVLADILDMVTREAPPVLIATLILVFLTLWALLGRLAPALLCVGAAGTTLLVTLGLLPLVGIRLNYLNIVVIPVLFGISVDGAVHLVSRLEPAASFVERLTETGRAIAGAVLTTSLGFGALMLADHPGLISVGRLAVLGLSVNLLVCLAGVPALLRLRDFGRGPAPPWTRQISTVGHAGFAPVSPGTVGALAALPAGWVLAAAPVALSTTVLAISVAVTTLAVRGYLRSQSDSDPQQVVIDEFIGCLVALAFVPWSWPWVVAAFALFRVLDIVKPWPIGTLDRRWKGAGGVMGDDIVAGLMAGCVLFGLRLWAF